MAGQGSIIGAGGAGGARHPTPGNTKLGSLTGAGSAVDALRDCFFSASWCQVNLRA